MKFLLLQVRDADDPMRSQEVLAFAETIGCLPEQIVTHDLLQGPPPAELFDRSDVILLGGSGVYRVSEGGSWLPGSLEAMRMAYRASKPTFASCMGFHLMTAALGGEVQHVPERAELGPVQLTFTDAGHQDPVFAPSGNPLTALEGHHDMATRLPREAILLASSDKVLNQAYRIVGKPIYCAQFHPELSRKRFLERVRAYPDYVEAISGLSYEEFEREIDDTPASAALLKRFIERVV